MSLRQVTVGVIGSGKISDTLVCDALNEHFAFGPPDAEGYFAKSTEFDVHLIVPVGRERFTDGIEAVWQWAMRCELPFLALSDGSESDLTEIVRESVLDPGDWQMSQTPEHSIVRLLQESQNPMLLVLHQENVVLEHDILDRVIEALSLGVPVYDLTRGLLEVTWNDLGIEPPEVPEPEQPQAAEEPSAPLALAATAAESVLVLNAAELGAVTTALTRAYTVVSDLLLLAREATELRPVLAAAERALRPLAPLVGSADTEEPSAPPRARPAPQEAEEEPPAGTRTRLEIYDEAAGEWRAAGRGRPKAGVRTRRVAK